MWLGELVGRLLWTIDEPYVRFVGAMVVSGCSVVGFFRVSRIFGRRHWEYRCGGYEPERRELS